MADIETLGILDEIQALVSDKLQVVSYKWLSRNFLVSSNTAKRLLEEFVEKNGSGLEVVYSLSGWLKDNPSVYHIRLVSNPKLAEAKAEFDGSCSVQVYSVQACIPKDPAVLWNAEFVQAEELYKQPPAVVNCLRDNRFCGVSNSSVKRDAEVAEVAAVSTSAPQVKNVGASGSSGTSFTNQTANMQQAQERKNQQSSTKTSLKSLEQVKDVTNGSHGTEAHAQGNKNVADKEKVPQFPTNKKKDLNEKNSSTGTGGSLASMWGRASTKTKPSPIPAETNTAIPVSSEAQVCAHEAVEAESSDDEGQQVNFKRASNGEGSRKRRVVLDFSDEEDEYKDAVSLASPDSPKKQPSPELKQSSKSSVIPSFMEKKILNSDEQKKDKPKVKKEKESTGGPDQLVTEASTVVSKEKKNGNPPSHKSQCLIPEKDASEKGNVSDAAPSSPKRRKVLKTRIDERGREVTEVVWEGDEVGKKPDDITTKNGDKNTVNNTVNRQPAAAKKSPAVTAAPSNTAGKAGNKKGGKQDPKQGNIMSFFKKKV